MHSSKSEDLQLHFVSMQMERVETGVPIDNFPVRSWRVSRSLAAETGRSDPYKFTTSP